MSFSFSLSGTSLHFFDIGLGFAFSYWTSNSALDIVASTVTNLSCQSINACSASFPNSIASKSSAVLVSFNDRTCPAIHMSAAIFESKSLSPNLTIPWRWIASLNCHSYLAQYQPANSGEHWRWFTMYSVTNSFTFFVKNSFTILGLALIYWSMTSNEDPSGIPKSLCKYGQCLSAYVRVMNASQQPLSSNICPRSLLFWNQ